MYTAVCEYSIWVTHSGDFLYCGDVALQCESIPMWCSEVCTVSSITKYVGLLCFLAQAQKIALQPTYA